MGQEKNSFVFQRKSKKTGTCPPFLLKNTIVSLNHDGSLHLAVSLATHHVAAERESAGLVRRQVHNGRLALIQFHIDPEIRNADAVISAHTHEFHFYLLAHLRGDERRRECPVRNLDTHDARLGCGRRNGESFGGSSRRRCATISPDGSVQGTGCQQHTEHCGREEEGTFHEQKGERR